MAKAGFRERNQKKIETLLEREDIAKIRAVVSHTIETKKIADKFPILDIIANSTRQKMGYSISFDDGAKILDKFKQIDEVIQSLIDEAIENGIFKPREKKKTKFHTFKDEIKQNILEGKNEDEIFSSLKAKDNNLELQTVKSWIGVVKTELEKEKEMA
jgi:hypothetical protein